jgi:hypothetical protein
VATDDGPATACYRVCPCAGIGRWGTRVPVGVGKTLDQNWGAQRLPAHSPSKVLAVVSVFPRAAPEENEACGDLLYPFEPADPISAVRIGLRITNRDVLEPGFARAVPGEDALASQRHFPTGPLHSSPSGERTPGRYRTGRLRRPHTLEVPGRPEGVVVHKPGINGGVVMTTRAASCR